jgi:hypothetical protein
MLLTRTSNREEEEEERKRRKKENRKKKNVITNSVYVYNYVRVYKSKNPFVV